MITKTTINVFLVCSLLYFLLDAIVDVNVLYRKLLISSIFSILVNVVCFTICSYCLTRRADIEIFVESRAYVISVLIYVGVVIFDIVLNELLHDPLNLTMMIVMIAEIVCKVIYGIVCKNINYRMKQIFDYDQLVV